MSHEPDPAPLRVRPAASADLDALVGFNAAMALETEGKRLEPERLRRGVAAVLADGARGAYHVAESGGRPVGALMITREWSDWRDAWFWWIQSVYVVPEARGRGVYRRLHEAVLSRAREAGDVCGLRLYVEHDNRSAQAVYRSLGMSPESYRMFGLELARGG